MYRSILLGLFFVFVSLSGLNVASAVTLDESGTGSEKPPIICHPFLSSKAEFTSEQHLYIFTGTCEGDVTGSYTITARWTPQTKRAGEDLILNSQTGTTYSAHFLSECTDDPWLTNASCTCIRRDGNAIGLLVSEECPCTPQYLPAEIRASFNQQFQAYNSTPPETPLNLKAVSKSMTEISLTWQDTSNKEEGFTLERRKEGDPPQKLPDKIQIPANTTTYLDSNLNVNTSYTYQIRSHFNNIMSSYSNQASAKTMLIPPQTRGEMARIFNAPSNLNASLDVQNKIVLQWQDNSSGENGFHLESKTASSPYTLLATIPGNSTSHTITQYAPSTAYFYRVRAYLGSRNTPWSNETTITSPGPSNLKNSSAGEQASTPAPSSTMMSASPLKPPLKLKAKSISATSIKLTWNDVCSNESGFIIERKKEGETYFEVIRKGPNEQAFIDQNVIPGTFYYYRLKAFNTVNESAYSKEVKVRTKDMAKSNKTTTNLAH